MYDKRDFSDKYDSVFGQIEIFMDPSKVEVISDYDERFFLEKLHSDDKLDNDMSFVLDALVSSRLYKDINVLLCDTIVIKNGAVSYFLFNTKDGLGPLRCERGANKLILPVLNTYFIKRRPIINGTNTLTKPRNFSNMTNVKSLSNFEEMYPDDLLNIQDKAETETARKIASDPSQFAYYVRNGGTCP